MEIVAKAFLCCCAVTFLLIIWALLDTTFDFKGLKERKIHKEKNKLTYLNSDIEELKEIVERLDKEIDLGFIKNKYQLRQRFKELVISYGYVPKLDLIISKEIKSK